jgi:hypothetical protein
MTESLADAIRALNVENVFVYVGDAVRWDYRSKRVANRGPTFRTVAASIHSPTSFASLVTGLYPPVHGVFSFTQSVAGTPRLFDVDGYQTRFVNSVVEHQGNIDPIFSVIDEEPDGSEPFTDLTEPFIVMERGPGGHAPYAGAATAQEYFESRSSAGTEALRSEYQSAVARDVNLFERRLSELEDRGLRDDTLIIYTSDHGELLGEGGMVGHNAPMRPELIYVPTTFVHPELSDVEDDGLFKHVNLVPTVLTALNEDGVLGELDGSSSAGENPGLTFYRNKVFGGNTMASLTLAYDGVWTADGGHVFARTGAGSRLAVLAGKSLKSPKRGFLRRHPFNVIWSYLASDRSYGTPGITVSDAERELEQAYARQGAESAVGADIELSDEANERLKDMGYL